MRVINVHEAKTHLSRLLEEVAAGEEIVLAKAGKPIARLVPLEPAAPKKRELGIFAHLAPDGIPDSFFEPLPEEELRAWEAPLFPDEEHARSA